MPENAQRRADWGKEHATTAPELRTLASERVRMAVDRAEEVGRIAGVVTIRTRPKPANQ